MTSKNSMVSENFTEMKYPIAIEWIFEREFFNRCFGGERLKTHPFQLSGFPVTYYLTMDYEQVDDQTPDFSMKLHCNSDYENVEIEAEFKIVAKLFSGKRLREKVTQELKYKFNDENTEIECYAVKEWEWYWKGDGVTFSLQGTFTIKGMPSIPLSLDAANVNEEMYGDNNGKDFTIVSEGQEIKVHKSILQQVSPVFGRMFESENWKETIESKIVLPFLPFKLTQIAVDAFYGKKYWRDLDKNEYIQLYQFADQYDIFALKNAIKNCIILTPQNVVEYTNVVVESKCEELKEADDQVFSSPLLKRKIQDENVTRNNCDTHIEKSKIPKIQDESKTGNSGQLPPQQ